MAEGDRRSWPPRRKRRCWTIRSSYGAGAGSRAGDPGSGDERSPGGRTLRAHCGRSRLPQRLQAAHLAHAGRDARAARAAGSGGGFSTELFARYQRNEQALVLALEMEVQGVSTRKVAAITEQWCGTSSPGQVSALTGRLDAELAAWRERPLTVSYPYLTVDARYEHVRVDGQVVSQGVLLVAGVRDDGRREILAVAVADTESEATYHELFRALHARGCAGCGW